MKFKLLAKRDLDTNVVLLEFKREKGLLEFLERFFNSLGVYDVFEGEMITNKVSYDGYYDLLDKYSYKRDNVFDLHIIRFDDSLILIFYLKTISRDKLVESFEPLVEFVKPDKSKRRSHV